MSSLIQLLKVTAIGLALTSLAACHPTYVRQSYQETYIPAHRPMPVYAPQYYASTPVYVERRTVVVPRVVVTPPRVVHWDDQRQRGRDHHVRYQHDHDRNEGKAKSAHVAQQRRDDADKPTRLRDERRKRDFDYHGSRGKGD